MDGNTAKRAFVTGGSRGIGTGIVQVLAQDGYDVAFTYNSAESEAAALKREVEALGRKCFYYQASLEQADVPEPVTKQAIDDLGGLELLVCNAGITRHNSLLTVQTELMDFLYGLNYRSYILCSKVAANHMVSQKIQGNIIFIASTRGIRAYPEDCLYGGLKAALIRSVGSLALEMAPHGIRVNCIAPGATAIRGSYSEEELKKSRLAQLVPLRRVGTPKEVGHLVKYLASDVAGYITGDTIKLDGGLILPGPDELRK